MYQVIITNHTLILWPIIGFAIISIYSAVLLSDSWWFEKIVKSESRLSLFGKLMLNISCNWAR